MPRRSAAPEVETRQLGPELGSVQDQEMLLYRPVPQLEGPPTNWTVSYQMVDNALAKKWLTIADSDPDFRQRPLGLAQLRRWRTLIRTKRFVDYLPNGVLCFDEGGMLLNGKHRLTAVESIDGAQCGFVVFENVPRWMFKYFDTGKTRTIKDVFHVGGRSAMPQTPSALRLALRYEEFLYGKRPGHGWRQWKQVPDEHEDLDEFLSRRLEMQDWYSLAEKMQRQAKLMTPAALVWRFYQSLAWPEGDEEITAFTDSLMTGSMLAPKSPVLLLRNWAKMCHEESLFVPAKRETHLFLLFKAFAQRESRLDALQWAYGMPMSLPYHPKGWEAAKENIMKALAELDATA